MKKYVVSLLMIISIISLYAIQKSISFVNSKSGVEIINERSSGIILEWSINQLSLSEISQESNQFTQLTANEFMGTSDVGLPQLPYMGKIIAVPVNADLTVNYLSTHSELIDLKQNGFNHVVYPAQPSVEKCLNPKDIPFEMNKSVYQLNNHSNFTPITIKEIGFMRGYRLISVAYTPVEYNPVKNTMRIVDNIRVEIVYNGADYAETEYLKEKTYSPAYESIMSDAILNYSPPSTFPLYTSFCK